MGFMVTRGFHEVSGAIQGVSWGLTDPSGSFQEGSIWVSESFKRLLESFKRIFMLLGISAGLKGLLES